MQYVRDRYPALFSLGRKYPMQLFMWQHDVVGVAHYMTECLIIEH